AMTRNISPYLVEGPDAAITNREKPLCDVPEIGIGNKPIDNGNYLFTPEEKAAFLSREPASEGFFRPWVGAEEFIQRRERWCLWLGDCPPSKLRQMPEAMKRVEAVREYRSRSVSPPTRKLADTPTRFHVENMPETEYLLIPSVSSERRKYIPMAFMDPQIITSNLCLIVRDATVFNFGVLSSTMHMSWVRLVCGRLKSDYRYSNKLVYNNYPWPEERTAKQRAAVEAAAQKVLDVRAEFADSSLADLYDPLTMPARLLKAHQALDRAVEKCYRSQPFESDRQRVEFLFALYEKLTSPLTAAARPRRQMRKM
ncbi:MAG: type IIL restriction-modification enzyme MmeI, partial [bacterium]